MALNNSCRHLPPESKIIEPEMLKILVEAEFKRFNDFQPACSQIYSRSSQ